MASIVTFDGARLGDEWAADVEAAQGGGGAIFNNAAWSFFSWGVISFAVSTAAVRAIEKFRGGGKQYGPTREHMQGARRRRRRR